ncbi:MAG: ferrous iron transporter B [Mariprofundales bacterium]
MQGPFFRGRRRPSIALLGQPGVGKSTIFQAVASTSVQKGRLLASPDTDYTECHVQIGMDEAVLVDLPSVNSLRHLKGTERETLKYLLWGNHPPLIAKQENNNSHRPSRPDAIIHILEASTLAQGLELAAEVIELGLPVVFAVNRMDEARKRGIEINLESLADQLGAPVLPTIALKGQGIAPLLEKAMDLLHKKNDLVIMSAYASEHLQSWLQLMQKKVCTDAVVAAFHIPAPLLATLLLENETYICNKFQNNFPAMIAILKDVERQIEHENLPRAIANEIAADRAYRAAMVYKTCVQLQANPATVTWDERLDALFLHPRWGLIGSLGIFAAILYVVFEVSALLDAATAARLIDLLAGWQPDSLLGVIARAVVDGLIGLIGIVVPYMLPLVLMLVTLEESGVMQRIAFVVDRFFHRIGLHGKVAVPFLLGLGCNVPAIASVAPVTRGHERLIAALLITFVPCSARSAIILALGGKYLGGLGVFLLFMLIMIVIAVLGHFLTRHYPQPEAGMIQEIPPYAMPHWPQILRSTWARTQDIITIVLPLSVAGSILLALLQFYDADNIINNMLSPLTYTILGLPIVLGVPIVFGVLRKELSLVMIYQALGSFDVAASLDWIQITTFLVFVSFYVPCVSTFAVMIKVVGHKEAWFSVLLSITVAIVVAVAARFLLYGVNSFYVLFF